jgi:hypothetical protein
MKKKKKKEKKKKKKKKKRKKKKKKKKEEEKEKKKKASYKKFYPNLKTRTNGMFTTCLRRQVHVTGSTPTPRR